MSGLGLVGMYTSPEDRRFRDNLIRMVHEITGFADAECYVASSQMLNSIEVSCYVNWQKNDLWALVTSTGSVDAHGRMRYDYLIPLEDMLDHDDVLAHIAPRMEKDIVETVMLPESLYPNDVLVLHRGGEIRPRSTVEKLIKAGLPTKMRIAEGSRYYVRTKDAVQ